MPPESALPGPAWYAGGLRFACTRCGSCCTGSPGTVRVDDDEIARLAARLGLSDAEFREAFTRRLRGAEVGLRERSDGSCVFLDARRGCSVYATRPRQCRTWPFWSSVVHSEQRWREEAEECPGMNRGTLRGATEIAALAADDGTLTSARLRARRALARRPGLAVASAPASDTAPEGAGAAEPREERDA